MTTTWQIFDTQYQTADGLIVTVAYACTVQLENYVDRTIGHLELTGNSSVEGFVPYANLTQDTIIGWVKNSLGTAQVSSIETSLQNNVITQQAAIAAETTKSGLPWRQ